MGEGGSSVAGRLEKSSIVRFFGESDNFEMRGRCSIEDGECQCIYKYTAYMRLYIPWVANPQLSAWLHATLCVASCDSLRGFLRLLHSY